MDRNHYTFIIYMVRSPSGKVYIGYTGKSLEERKACHEKDAKTSKLPFHKAIRKYKSTMTWKTIKSGIQSLTEAHELEKFYILKYKSHISKLGYNCTLGGEGCTATKATKKKISDSIKALGANPGRLRQKAIRVFKDGLCVGEFANQIDCADALKLRARDISRCLRGRRKTYKGFTFR